MTTFTGKTALEPWETESAAELMEETWPGWGERFLKEAAIYAAHADFFNPFYAVCTQDCRVTGLSLLLLAPMSTDITTLSWVAVRKAQQGQGIGRTLVEMSLKESRRRGMRVLLTADQTQHGFYTALGFTIAEHYTSDVSRVLMTCR